MIPANEQLGVPAASEPSIFVGILQKLQQHSEVISDGLSTLNSLCETKHHQPFGALNDASQMAMALSLGRDAPFILALTNATTLTYYADPRVLASLNMPGRAPFPEGHTVPDGDWQLLDPVKQRAPFWRAT